MILLDGLDMDAAFQEGKSGFAVWKGAVLQSPRNRLISFLFSSMAVFAFGQVLSLELRAKEASTVWFLLHSDKQVFVLCKFTALHYRNTWLYSPIFPNADNCQDWLIKSKVGSVILWTCPSSHHVSIHSFGSLLSCHTMLIPFSNISLSYSLERWKREKFFRSLKLSLLPVETHVLQY